ncbi:polyprenyl synthetase family protein [Streptomyces djakartensis]|uniref:polyprenyl synthetase family protein n=1 Tax=Streptomyces djakartensis TaxID=68193 RepID=UPI0034DFBB0C
MDSVDRSFQEEQSSHGAHELASGLLAEAQADIHPTLRAAIERLPSTFCRIAGYHFGWWDGDGVSDGSANAGGKSLRPALVLASARAMKTIAAKRRASPITKPAVTAAVAVELVHNFSILHDDVMDGDLVRRHRPTAWAKFGTGNAILTGDLLLSLAHDLLAESLLDSAQDLQAARILSNTVLRMCEGQAADLALQETGEATVEEALHMISGKTAALFACACQLGAIAGGANAEQAEVFRAFGHNLGMAFQLVDDLLGIWGDPSFTGKPVGKDLLSRKMSVPVVVALNSDTIGAEQLRGIYSEQVAIGNADVKAVTRLIEATGARTLVAAQAEQHYHQAARHLRYVDPDNTASTELQLLARLVTERQK